MKRFYKLVSQEKREQGYAILLDGHAMKTKSGTQLLAQNEQVATEIVREWAAQGENIDPETMPFTQILNTRIDQVKNQRKAMNIAVLKYLDTDLVCYPAEEPKALYEAQERHWAPIRAWIEKHFGHPLETTTGLKALEQPTGLHKEITAYVETMSDDLFTLLQVAVPVSGSLIIGLALMEKQITAQAAFEACFIEEHYKEQIYLVDEYGRDPLSEYKQASVLRDLKTCETYRNYLT